MTRKIKKQSIKLAKEVGNTTVAKELEIQKRNVGNMALESESR